MNTTKVTFGMLNVVATSVLVANFYMFKKVAFSGFTSFTKVNVSEAKAPGENQKAITTIYLDKVNLVFPKKKEPQPDLFKKQRDIITFNTNTTPGIVFRIQVLASKDQVPLFSERLKGLDNIREEYSNGIYKYTVGEFKTPGETDRAFSDLETKGYNDSFVVAFKDGNPINVKSAMEKIRSRY